MKKIIKLLLVILMMFVASNLFAQTTPEWFKFYLTPDMRNTPNASVVDNNGNVYMTGETINFSEEQETDILIIGYDKDGNLKWISTINDDCNQDESGNAIAVDADGDVYVAGYLDNCYNLNDFIIIKYDSSGDLT